MSLTVKQVSMLYVLDTNIVNQNILQIKNQMWYPDHICVTSEKKKQKKLIYVY